MEKTLMEEYAAKDRYETPAPRGIRSVVLATLLFYPRLACIVASASRRAKRKRYDRVDWQKSSQSTLVALEKSGCIVEIDGLNNIAACNGPAVFIGNHMSTAETFLLPGIIDPIKPCTFVIKPSLIDYPFFAHVMRSRDPIVVSRDNPRQDLATVMSEGRSRLESGISVVLFPQTTRIAGFDAAKFNSLGVKLAKAAGVPVVPIALRTDAWGNGRIVKEFGRINPTIPMRFRFFAPVQVSGNGRDEHERITASLAAQLETWGLAVIR